ncbi:MAG: hypothetical protein AAB447_03545 [Patescibacteria group bacterium]
MKKTSIVAVVVIVLLLISGYVENNYCRIWVTTDPIGAPKDYRHTTGFCNLNSYVSIPGAFFLGWLK